MPHTLAQLTNPMVLNPELMKPETLLGIAVLRAKAKRAKAAHATAGIPQTDDELWQYVANTWGVKIPRVKVCPGHVAPFTAFADAYFARHSMNVWKASRGLGGKSFMLATLGATLASTQGANVVILGGSGQQSANVHTYMTKLWTSPGAPQHLLSEPPLTTETRFAKGNKIIALTASQSSVRGPHPEKLLLDECDEMDLPIFDAAMGQTMSRGGIPACTVASSTHHYADSTFTEILKRASARGWPVYEWCMKESMAPHGWLDEAEIARKRNEMTEQQWTTEVELQEPSPENRAILPEAVRYMFQRELGVYEGNPREYIEVEPPEPGARYAHGADWAKSIDWTEIITLRVDVTPARLVAYERMQRLSWPYMVGRFEKRIGDYGADQSPAAHDGTGLGDVVDGYLTVSAEKIVLAGRTRSDIFSNYISAIERGAIISPFIKALEAQYRFATIGDLYGAGHPPDGFVAGAIAWHVAELEPARGW